jgi:hypothetical protein
VAAADRRHVNDLALDQLDAHVGAQRAGFDHPKVFVGRDPRLSTQRWAKARPESRAFDSICCSR